MDPITIKRDDVEPEEEQSDNESHGEPEVDMGEDSFKVSDSEIIEFESEAQDDCLDAIFCPLINSYLRVGALCPKAIGQWVLKSLSSIATAPEEVQSASVVVVEIPYNLLNTIIPPYRNQVTSGGVKKTRFKKSATVKFRKGLNKTAGFFVKTHPAPHKLHNSLAVLNFGRGKSAKFMYMASLDILSYRLIALPAAEKHIASQARIFATGLGPNCLMPQISALLSAKGLLGNPAVHMMDPTGQLGDASTRDKVHDQFTYALAASIGKRPIAPAPRGPGTSGADTPTSSSSRQMATQAGRTGQLPNNMMLNPLLQRQIAAQLAWYQNVLTATQRGQQQKNLVPNALMLRMFPQGIPQAAGEGGAAPAEGDAAVAAAAAAVGGASPSGEGAEGEEEKNGVQRQLAPGAIAPRPPVLHPMASPNARGVMMRPLGVQGGATPGQPVIAPRGSLMSKLLAGAQKKANQLPAISLIFQLYQSGFPRAAQYLLAICADRTVATARDLLMQVTEEQLQKHLQEDQDAKNAANAAGGAEDFDQTLHIASSLIPSETKEGGAGEAAAEKDEGKAKGKKRGRGKKGEKKGDTTNDDLLQQLATAAALAHKKDMDADEEGDEEEGSEGESADEAKKSASGSETVGGLLDWLSSMLKDEEPRDYPWGRRGRASTASSADEEGIKNGRGKRARSQASKDVEADEEDKATAEASGEIEIDVQTGEIVSTPAIMSHSEDEEGGDGDEDISEADEPGAKRMRKGKGAAGKAGKKAAAGGAGARR